MKKTIIAILAVIVLFSCRTSFRVQDKSQQTPDNAHELITYYLPKTLLKIKIPIEKNELKVGLISKLVSSDQINEYAYLLENYGWEKVEVDEKFTLGEKIQFIPITVPDPAKQFTISYKKSRSIEQSLGLTLGKDGIITSGEFAQSDKTYEYVTKGVELLASTAAKLYGLGKGELEDPRATTSDVNYNRIKKLLAELDQITDAKALLIRNPTNGVSTLEPTKFRLDLIDKRIKAIHDEIMGKIKTTVINLSLIYEPGNKTGDLTLLKIDPKNGYQIPNPLGALPSLDGSFNVQDGEAIKKLEIRPSIINPVIAPKKAFTTSAAYNSEHFLVYNVPVKYSIELLLNGKQLKSFSSAEDEKGSDAYEIWFPQMGQMAALPYGFKELKVVFFEDIGAIKEFKYTKGAQMDATAITSGITALDSLVSLRNKYKESKKEKPVEEEKEEIKEQVIRLIIDKPAA